MCDFIKDRLQYIINGNFIHERSDKMAHTLTFDNAVYCKINGALKDSPYTLHNGDVIIITPNFADFVVNGTTYDSEVRIQLKYLIPTFI